LAGSAERWLALRTVDDFQAWLEEREFHQDSVVGVFARFGRSLGWHKTGTGTPHLLSAGCYYDPGKWQPPFREQHCLQPAGFYHGETAEIQPFSHLEIAEHVRYPWHVDSGDGRHLWQSQIIPECKTDGEPYSYGKAPRYQDRVVQLGPFADLIIAGNPLMTSFFKAEGPTTWLRQLTRLHRPVAGSRR
jgi:hydrogenase large subunit